MTSNNRTDDGGRDPKRRKLRKGTHSCWACKRRKIRCTLSTLSGGGGGEDGLANEADIHGAVCDGCRHRGTVCFSQDIPEDLAQGMTTMRHHYHGRQTGHQSENSRLDRIEALVQALVKNMDGHASSVSSTRRRDSSLEASSSLFPHPSHDELQNGGSQADDVRPMDSPVNRPPAGPEDRREPPLPTRSTAPQGLPTPDDAAKGEPTTYTTWFGHQRVIEEEVPQPVAFPSTSPASTTVSFTACVSDTARVLGTSPAAGAAATPGGGGCYGANKEYMDKYNGLMVAWPSQDDLRVLVEILSAINRSKAHLSVISGPTSTVLAATNPPVGMRDVRELLMVPPAGTHLVLVALKLLTIALVLQHLSSTDSGQTLSARLRVPPQRLMQAAVDTANTLVVSQECLVGSLEGVHCLVLIGIYQANLGNLRRAWLTVRKAMTMAQLMGMHRSGMDIGGGGAGVDKNNSGSTTTDPTLVCLDAATRDLLPPQCLWFRIVFADRFLSLMLGLPQGVPGDQAVTCSSTGRMRGKMEATLAQPVFGTDTEEARRSSEYVTEARKRLWQIEYRHAIIVGRILERNEAWRGEDDEDERGREEGQEGCELENNELGNDELEEEVAAVAAANRRRLSTEAIDWALQRTSRSMPAQWWQTPSLDEWEEHDGEYAFLMTQRVVDQLLHYHLLAQLHLPFMLRQGRNNAQREGRDRGPRGRGKEMPTDRFAYSKITCVSASREVLTRFLSLPHLRGSAITCRSIDFFALLASMTLCLAHLDSHRHEQLQRKKRKNRSYTATDPELLDMPDSLAHQRHSDRGMMERVLESMNARSRVHGDDALAHKSVVFLRRILAIEEAAAGKQTRIGVSVPQESLRIWVPYLGTIRLSRDGIFRVRNNDEDSKKTNDISGTDDNFPAPTGTQRPSQPQQPSQLLQTPVLPSTVAGEASLALPYAFNGPVAEAPGNGNQTGGGLMSAAEAGASNHAFQYNPFLPPLQSGDYPLPGVDLAYFENLLMHSSLDDLALCEPTSSLPALDMGLMTSGHQATDNLGCDARET